MVLSVDRLPVNIFYLDTSPSKAAEYSCDKHCVKMILESAQLLCTAHWILTPEAPKSEYFFKPTHVNHPCSVWVKLSVSHYRWLHQHLEALCKEYTRRYQKIHKVEREGLLAFLCDPPISMEDVGFSDPPQAMIDSCRVPGNAVAAYRNYYMQEKNKIAKWKLNNVPEWYNPDLK